MAKQTSNDSESASACAVAGSTPEASLTSSRNALNCHVDPLLDNPATSTLNWVAFVDAAHFVEPAFLSESRGASRVTFIEVWRCFFRSTGLFALRSAAARRGAFRLRVVLRSFASSASSTFSCAFASAARHRPTFSRSDAISASRAHFAVLAVATLSFARSAAACVPGVGCGVRVLVAASAPAPAAASAPAPAAPRARASRGGEGGPGVAQQRTESGGEQQPAQGGASVGARPGPHRCSAVWPRHPALLWATLTAAPCCPGLVCSRCTTANIFSRLPRGFQVLIIFLRHT